jgi:hypothetical protein
MTQLQNLLLDQNPGLSGPLPPEFGALTNLQALFLDNTQVSGRIPPSWSNMNKLMLLDLRNTSVAPCFGAFNVYLCSDQTFGDGTNCAWNAETSQCTPSSH